MKLKTSTVLHAAFCQWLTFVEVDDGLPNPNLEENDADGEAIMLYGVVLEKQENAYGEMHEISRLGMKKLLPVYMRAKMLGKAESLGRSERDNACFIKYCHSRRHLLFLPFTSKLDRLRNPVCEDAGPGAREKPRPTGQNDTLYTMTDLA
ncbi:MAG: hypothetical protein Q9178_003880 [Gyalolechia marmorata]